MLDIFLGMEYTENADFLYFFREIRVFRALKKLFYIL